MDYYPEVVGELDTLRAVVGGKSIARYGDGEFKMCYGASIKSQEHHPRLQARLREILDGAGDCLVGIPNILSKTPKHAFWGPHMRFHELLNANRQYYSSFITRPDSAPWVDTPEFWETFESLWKDRDVTLVRGSGKSLCAHDLTSAKSVTEVLAPIQHAWADYDNLLARIGTPERVIICLGPTATVMAVDLCSKGVQAIDLGHGGMFWRKHCDGRPLWVEKEDKPTQTPEGAPAL